MGLCVYLCDLFVCLDAISPTTTARRVDANFAIGGSPERGVGGELACSWRGYP